MTDIYIVSGFLGAGKTTLIKTMLQTLFNNKKIVVIENEFGDAGIDAGLLRECSLTVTSLNAGCICCSLMGDFEKSVDRILNQYEPDAIVVEPSGVGRLSDIAKSCLRLEEEGRLRLKKNITVVDVRTFDKYLKNYGGFFEDQITYADLVLLSHQTQRQEEAGSVERAIRKMNPEARVETGLWECIPCGAFLDAHRNASLFQMEMDLAVAMKPVRVRAARRKKGFFPFFFASDIFSAVTLECKEAFTKEQLRKRVLHVIQNADGEILRGKGIVANGSHSWIFHFVPDSLEIEPANIKGSQVCFIGTGLDQQQIQILFSEEPSL
ncbi:MAG: GTP-binding protein [Clostridiaceae bacterium]|uniref:GTP-binding protein n=1 Tax=Clostridium porci TaxID=2605778 RepID=A0A7X2TC49_9CLOT|nr:MULTISPECIES: GTP-binding protein [Clostridium]MCI6138995.1 GTP-binding protein [Clostridium sp.]MDY3231212.1 GTP-binding protein [Clostridiaceae bacterium]MSS35546.1 GTP-binding protein [Clostridium porci]